jgi:hypothetical protein
MGHCGAAVKGRFRIAKCPRYWAIGKLRWRFRNIVPSGVLNKVPCLIFILLESQDGWIAENETLERFYIFGHRRTHEKRLEDGRKICILG